MSLKLFIFILIFPASLAHKGNFCEFLTNYLQHYNVKYSYFFICESQNELIEFCKPSLFKAGVRLSVLTQFKQNEALWEKPITQYGFVLEHSCPDFEKVLVQNPRVNYRLTRPWLILTNVTDLSYWKSFFDNIPIRLDSAITLAVGSKYSSLELLNVYNPGFKLNGNSIISKIGYWNGSELYIDPLSFYLQRKDMTGIVIRSGSVVLLGNHSGTFEEYMMDSRYKQLDTMSKFHYPIFLILEEVHKFTHTLKIRDKWFGNYQNGSDGGIGKLLYEDRIDITSTGASQRPPRVDIYDYLMPSYHFRPCYIFRNPGNHNPFSNEFLKPFSSVVWYIVIAITIVICIILKMFYAIENHFGDLRTKYSWVTVVLTTFAIILQQGSSVLPTDAGGRLAYLVLLVFSILLYNFYTSSIISSLLSTQPEIFKTLDELGHSSLEIGIEDLPYTLTWFEIMNDSDVQHIYRHKVFPPGAKRLNILPAEEGIAKVGKGGFAYHTQLDTGYPIIAKTFDQDAICDLNEIPMIPQVHAGTMVQKKSQFRELFHVTLRKAKQAGLVHRIAQIWESDKPECLSGAQVVAVGADQAFMAFLMLLIGIILSILVLFVEILWSKI